MGSSGAAISRASTPFLHRQPSTACCRSAGKAMGLLGFLILLLLQPPGPLQLLAEKKLLALLALHMPEELTSSLLLAPQGRKHKQQRGSVLARVTR